MAKDFYYSFKTDFDTGSVIIGVDDVVFRMHYLNKNRIEPQFISTKKGYSVFYKNIYDGIDIKFDLEPEKIKETIIVKSQDSVRDFIASVDVVNGTMDRDEKEIGGDWNVCDRHGNTVFSFPHPYVVEKNRRKTALDSFVSMVYDFNSQKFFYKFNHENVKKYPVIVDPSFSFPTNIKNRSRSVYGPHDYRNTMMLTGNKSGISRLNERIQYEVTGNSRLRRNYFSYTVSGDGTYTHDPTSTEPEIQSVTGLYRIVDNSKFRNDRVYKHEELSFWLRYSEIRDSYVLTDTPSGEIEDGFTDFVGKNVRDEGTSTAIIKEESGYFNGVVVMQYEERGNTVPVRGLYKISKDHDEGRDRVFKHQDYSFWLRPLPDSGIVITDIESGDILEGISASEDLNSLSSESDGILFDTVISKNPSNPSFNLGNRKSNLKMSNTGTPLSILSDDVIFEDKMTVAFAWPMPGMASVVLNRGSKKITYKNIMTEYVVGQNINGIDDQIYSILTVDIPFNSPGEIGVACSFSKDRNDLSPFSSSQTYYYSNIRGAGTTYKRSITYLPKIDIFLPNYTECVDVDVLDGHLRINNLHVRHIDSFKPVEYSILPYSFKRKEFANNIEGSYSFVVLPDTQYYSKGYPSIFTSQTQWIVDNVEELNIKHVFHLGDITHDNTEYQWINANDSLSLLDDNNVPYSVIRGNHDSSATNGATFYDEYFPFSRFSESNMTAFGGKGSYDFEVNGGDNNDHNYEYRFLYGNPLLFLNLSRDDQLSDEEWSAVKAWAKNIIASWPLWGVIITTHDYLRTVEKTAENEDTDVRTSIGNGIWTDVIEGNSNVLMVLCGDEHTETKSENILISQNGTTQVYQILTDYQDRPSGSVDHGNGWLRIYQVFDSKFYARTYSPYLDKWEDDADSKFGPIPDDFPTFRNLAESDTFKKEPHIVEGNTIGYLSTYFNIDESIVPIPEPIPYESDFFVAMRLLNSPIADVKKGFLKSFVNRLNIVLKSAVNRRMNAHEETDFEKQYFAISSEDFIIKKVNATTRAVKNIEIKLYIHTFMSLFMNEGSTIQDHVDFCSNLGVKSLLDIVQYASGYTELVFLDLNVFDQILNRNMLYETDGVDKVEFRNLSKDILKGASLIADIDGEIRKFNITSNNDYKIEINGKYRDDLMKAKSFAVLFLDPDEIFFKNDTIVRNTVPLKKDAINSDGTVSYETVLYDTDVYTGYEEVGFYEKKKDFSLVKPINLFKIENI